MPSPALNRVAVREALDDEVEALVARIVAKPRVAIAPGKALFYRQLEPGIVSAYEDAGATMAYNMMDLSALRACRPSSRSGCRTCRGAGVNKFARAALADAPWRRHHGHARLVDPAPTGATSLSDAHQLGRG
jgi:hypothetical protein